MNTAALRNGLAAGAVGVCVEALWSAGVQRVRRRAPVYDPALMARRLLHRHLGRAVDRRTANSLGVLIRAIYGASWGVATAMLMRGRGRVVANALGLAAAIWLFELVALPRTGATPPLGHWPRGEAALDTTNAIAYSAVTCSVLARLTASQRSPRRWFRSTWAPH